MLSISIERTEWSAYVTVGEEDEREVPVAAERISNRREELVDTDTEAEATFVARALAELSNARRVLGHVAQR